MKNPKLKSKAKTIGKPKTERRVAVQRLVSPPLDGYFQIPAHQATISAEDFINGKMPAIVKRANKLGHMVRLTVAG